MACLSLATCTHARSVAGPELISISMKSTTVGWGITRHSIFRTEDGGRQWLDVSPQQLPVSSIGAFFLDADTAWVSFREEGDGSSGLARTTDGGKTWTIATRSAPMNPVYRFTNQHDGWCKSVDIGAGNAYIRLFRTTDGGTTWNSVPGIVHLCNICGDTLSVAAERFIVTYGDRARDPGGVVRLSRSPDLGRTWHSIHLPLPTPSYRLYHIVPRSPVFFGREDGIMPVFMVKHGGSEGDITALSIYSTRDGGVHWKAAPSVLDNVDSFADPDIVSPLVAVVRCGHNLCVTRDGGAHWAAIGSNLDFARNPSGKYVSQVDFVNERTGWALLIDQPGRSLWRTDDGGRSWIELLH